MNIDETWIQDLTLDSNRQSAEWTVANERHTKRPKNQTSAGKILDTVFWDAHDILFPDYIGKGRTIISEIGMMVRVFANCLGELGSIPGRVIPKTQKVVLDASLLNTQHYKVRIKSKLE